MGVNVLTLNKYMIIIVTSAILLGHLDQLHQCDYYIKSSELE